MNHRARPATRRLNRALAGALALSGCLALPDALPPVAPTDAEPDQARPALDASAPMVDAGRPVPRDAEVLDLARPTADAAIMLEERCNGLDDDKDDLIDEGVINLCGVCGPLPAEACDAIDNDCDFLIDEEADCDCSPGTLERCSIDVGRCTEGERLCDAAGRWSSCSGAGPTVESCNGFDDDCDGAADEALLNACGRCGLLPLEVCDGLDNDCDAMIDEGTGGGTCPLEGQGPCAIGQTTCRAASVECVQVTFAAPEACNGRDDDCDGAADEALDGADCVVAPDLDCAPGRYRCAEGVGACVAQPELRADGVDEDCDGQVDEFPPDQPLFDLADAAIGGLGLRPGLPPAQVVLPDGHTLPQLSAVPTSPFVEGIFVPRNNGSTTINRAGDRLGFGSVVGATRWSRLHAKGPDVTIDPPSRRDYGDPETSSVLEMHANYGITFDLAAIAAHTGRAPIRFTGRSGNARNRRYGYAVVVDGERRMQAKVGEGREAEVSAELAGALRLTLVLTDGDTGISSRHTYFGDPLIELADGP